MRNIMINLVTTPSTIGSAVPLGKLVFDSKKACDSYPINSHSFKPEFDSYECALKLTSLTSMQNDQGFTADNRDEEGEAAENRIKYVELLKKTRVTVLTYKNPSAHTAMCLRTGRCEYICELMPSSDKWYSLIIPCDAGDACFRSYATNKPSNSSVYPFFGIIGTEESFRAGDEIFYREFAYFDSIEAAKAYCDAELAKGRISGWYKREKLNIDLLAMYKGQLSEATVQKILDTEKGIAPVSERRAPLDKYLEPVPDGLIAELDAKFDARVEKIRATESEWTCGEGCRVIYLSQSGDDLNSGLDASHPKKTIASLDALALGVGAVVLFKRGDVWHEQLTTTVGVTYSAWGEGKKPEIRGSIDASGKDKWIECGKPGLYRFCEKIPYRNDVGNIVFDEGAAFGARVLKEFGNDAVNRAGDNGYTSNGIEYWYRESEPMKGPEVLSHDLEYVHNYEDETLYLYSLHGNPGERFSSIELSTHGNAVNAKSGVTLDNLCLRFTGSHGIGAGTCENLTVRNCEVGFIGGSLQHYPESKNTRYGNAIEIYGGCEHYRVYNNYVYECFDCGPTVQWQGGLSEGRSILENDIEIYGNAIEKCNSPLEVWCTTAQCDRSRFAVLSNIRLYDNLCRKSGYGIIGGYNHQKTDYNMFYGGGQTNAVYENAYIEDNAMWYIRKYLQKAVPTHTGNGMGFNWRNNTIIKDLGSPLALLGTEYAIGKGGLAVYYYDEATLGEMYESGAFGENKFYYTHAKAPKTFEA